MFYCRWFFCSGSSIVQNMIEDGNPPKAMVGWKGQLSDAEIEDVLAQVKSLRQ